jgi:hypothetical protein
MVTDQVVMQGAHATSAIVDLYIPVVSLRLLLLLYHAQRKAAAHGLGSQIMAQDLTGGGGGAASAGKLMANCIHPLTLRRVERWCSNKTTNSWL